MPTVAISQSKTHPVRVDLIKKQTSDWTIKTIELPTGPLERDKELVEAVEDVHAIILRPGSITPCVLENAPNLEAVAIHGSGYSRVNVDAATEHGVVVTHNPGGPGPAVAEHTLALILALLRDIDNVFQRTNKGKWNSARRFNTELSRQTVGIVGLGTIGFDFAQRLVSAFDSEILAYDPYVMGKQQHPTYPRVSSDEAESVGIELVELKTMLDQSDIVTLHTPLTDETKGLIGEEEIERLTNSYLVNTSRGGVIDEEPLVRAVENDRLAGVALDVLDTEPPNSDNPLLRSEKVLVTPHTAGVSDGYLERAAELSAQKVDAVFRGEQPDTTLNPEVFE
jgi:D-3-phosphoglycerate dehydrogenase